MSAAAEDVAASYAGRWDAVYCERASDYGLTLPELRPHQAQAYVQLRDAAKAGNKRNILMAVCSWGKTVFASYIACQTVMRNRNVLLCVDTLELISQTIDVFERAGLRVGVIQGQHEQTDTRAPVQIATMQTLARRMSEYADYFEMMNFATIIVDEAHQRYNTLDMLHSAYPTGMFIGLTATPWRKGMASDWDGVIHTMSVKAMLEKKWLTPTIVYSHPCPSWAKVKIQGGEYVMSEAAREYTPKLIGSVIDTYRDVAADRHTILYACDVSHAQAMTQEFQAAGFDFATVHGGTDKDERRELVQQFKAGKLQGLSTCLTMIKGLDATIADCMVDVQPTRSLMRHYQKLGRIARLHPGKQNSIVLDFAGNAIRNGLPDADVPVTLDDGSGGSARKDARDKDDPLPAKCGSCGALRPPGPGACPACGWKPERQAVPLDHEPGELEILTGEPAPRPKQAKVSTLDKQLFWGEALAYAAQTGRKSGWAYYAFQERFGHKPQGYAKQRASDVSHPVYRWCENYAARSRRKWREQQRAGG